MGSRAMLLAIFAAVLWGGNSVSIKISLEGVGPLNAAWIRFLLGSLVIFAWCRWAGIPLRLRKGEIRSLAPLFALFVAQILLLNFGTLNTTASRSTVLVSTFPFFTATLAHRFIPGDRLSTAKVVGMLLSFFGIVVLFGESLYLRDLGHFKGDIIVLGSAILLGTRQVFTKHLSQAIDPGRLLFWQGIFSLPVFFLLGQFFEADLPWSINGRVLMALVFQGIVIAGFCFALWTTLLRRYRASSLGAFGFVTPVCGVVLSHWLVGDTLSLTIWISVMLVGAGITIVNKAG